MQFSSLWMSNALDALFARKLKETCRLQVCVWANGCTPCPSDGNCPPASDFPAPSGLALFNDLVITPSPQDNPEVLANPASQASHQPSRWVITSTGQIPTWRERVRPRFRQKLTSDTCPNFWGFSFNVDGKQKSKKGIEKSSLVKGERRGSIWSFGK